MLQVVATLQEFEGLKSYSMVSITVPRSDGGIKSVPGRGGSVIKGFHAQEEVGEERAVQFPEAVGISRN